MKRFATLSTLLLSALLLTSCYLMSTHPTGTIKLSFGSPSGRAISPTATARVYLYTYRSSSSYSLFTFPSGGQYVELQYGSGTTSLTNIPVGMWNVLVSIGGYTGTAFQVSSYGDSGVINVFGGMDTPASVVTKAMPFTYSTALVGQSLNSVLFDYLGGANANAVQVLYVSSPSALYSITPSTPGLPPDLTAITPASITPFPTGLQIQSLSEGYYSASASAGLGKCMFVNGNNAILPYYAGGFDTTLWNYWLGPSPRLLYTILASSAVVSTVKGVAVYYTRNQVFGGSYFDGTTYNFPINSSKVGAPWVSIDASSKTSGNPVYEMSSDVYTTNGFTYFATVLGAFRADPSLVTAGSANASNVAAMLPITAPNNATIQAIAVDDYDNVLYIGTSQGAYYATLSESSATSAISGSWTLIPATAGESITSIKVDASTRALSTPKAVAFRSSSNNIYTYNAPPAQGGTERTLPFYSGLPGTVTAMDFAYGVLFIAGTEGLASVTL